MNNCSLFCFRFVFEKTQSEYFSLISIGFSKQLDKSDIAEYELFKADFNLYLEYGKYINTHLLYPKFLRSVVEILPNSELALYKGGVLGTQQNALLSFTDPKVDEVLILKMIRFIHSKFLTRPSNPNEMIKIAQFKEDVDANQLSAHGIVFFL